MAKRPSLPTITGAFSSATQLNAAFRAIETAMDNTLSLDGSTPNSMSADLDLNSNDIINAGVIYAADYKIDGEPLGLAELIDEAETSAATATAQAALAAASFNEFDARYLGAKASNPTTDNDGGALVVGALYFNTAVATMKLWNGSIWTDTYTATPGALIASNNLADVDDEATARGNLGAQAADADLTALAALSTTGLIARTGAGTASVRTLTGTTDQITVTNGNGVSGNPTLSLAFATQIQAETGSDTVSPMNSLRVSQAIENQVPGLIPPSSITWLASQSASGTTVTFTNIPTSATEIYVFKNGISLSGTDHYLVRLGDNSAFKTADYLSTSVTSSTISSGPNSTTGFIVQSAGSTAATYALTGLMSITKIGSVWLANHSCRSNENYQISGDGLLSVAPAGGVTRVQVLATGANSLDTGTLQVGYR